jgi:hypothetical protein
MQTLPAALLCGSVTPASFRSATSHATISGDRAARDLFFLKVGSALRGQETGNSVRCSKIGATAIYDEPDVSSRGRFSHLGRHQLVGPPLAHPGLHHGVGTAAQFGGVASARPQRLPMDLYFGRAGPIRRLSLPRIRHKGQLAFAGDRRLRSVPKRRLPGGYDHGVCRLPPGARIGEPCRLLTVDRLSGEFTTHCLLESATGQTWVATTDALFRLSPDGRSLERMVLQLRLHEVILALADGQDGSVLIGTVFALFEWKHAAPRRNLSHKIMMRVRTSTIGAGVGNELSKSP